MTRGSVAARWAVRAAALSTLSCGSGGPIDHDLGSLVTIVQGIYGQVVFGERRLPRRDLSPRQRSSST